MMTRRRLLTLTSCLLLLAGCASRGETREDLARQPRGPQPEVGAAYSLLYHVVSDEAEVAGLFLLRSPSEPTKSIVREIAAVSQRAREDLEGFAATAEDLRLDAGGLPAAEVRAREIIAGWEKKNLLFGGNLTRDLLLSQIEATKYIAALAQHLGDTDTDFYRATTMKELAQQMLDLHDQLREQLQPVPRE